MTWTLTASLDEFRAEAGALLTAHPAQNTVLLTIADRLARSGPHVFGTEPPRFGWWRPEPDGPVTGVYLQTPPYPPRLGVMPVEAGAALADALNARTPAPTGVSGTKPAALAFAERWQALTGTTAHLLRDERLYRLGRLTPPDPAPAGHVRTAGPGDRELLIRWFGAFATEVGIDRHADLGAQADRWIAEGSSHLWEDGGRPVSLAGAGPVVAGMSRIGPVYTPPELRARGYAAAVVAAASAHAIAAGAGEVLLYTDLANPTSNSLYQRLGYRPVEDSVVLSLH
ncbi:GNAT family N-acetyltransferase [Kitasatospora paracochleata]|uniref:GNAT family acetyltransferase n=1 Tax=Kitasatospora paracochleata TaxID=58354 RepID=A0ABT1IQF1_9ACTN|nr:GNAT family N-acetyltransferase [Kitasatospora paracochleata]MCP2307332.1 putative GNAT family acetyltransferase [Kitasatospora paracochleata]